MKTPYILLTLVLLLGSTLLVQAYSQAGTLTVKVDKTSYRTGETIRVTGTVPAVIEGVPVGVFVFNPRNTMYTIDQVTPNADGTYSTSFDITGKLGISGVYTVKATYSGQSVQATFQYTSFLPQTSPGTYRVEYQGNVFNVKASFSNGSITKIEVDPEFTSLIISVNTSATQYGTLGITLPRELIDARTGQGRMGDDDKFIVLVDGNKSDKFKETATTATERSLSIPVPAGTEEIEIVGTVVVGKASPSPTFQIIIPAGTATPGCEAVNKCWDPSTMTVPAGTTVVWTNKDTAGHTVTSGNPGDAYSGSHFDSTKDPSGFLIKPGTTWKWTFDKAGEFPYFCAVHPWMLGKVIVGSASTQITIGASTQASSFTIGDTVRISGSVKPVTIGQPLVIQVFNPNGSSFRFDQIKVDSSGSFAYSFKIEGTLATIGNYRIDIGYFDSKKSLIINVEKGASITTGKVTISGTSLVDASGSSISHMSVGQQVLVQSKVMNNQDVTQDYAYILQIKNSDDIVVSLSWVQGSINSKQSLNVAQSWLPDSAGTYTTQIFVWRSITNPLPLASSIVELKFDVSA